MELPTCSPSLNRRIGPMSAPAAESLLSLAEDASARLRGPDSKEALELLETSYSDLVAALGRFIDEKDTGEALRLANALYRFWITKQRFDEGAVWFDRALGIARWRRRPSRPGLAPRRLHAVLDGRRRRARRALRSRLSRSAAELGDPAMISQALGGLARVALRTDVAEGRRLAREALAVSEARPTNLDARTRCTSSASAPRSRATCRRHATG